MHHAEPGEHRRAAKPEVGHDIEQRDHAGPLVRRRQRNHRADTALEATAEPNAGDHRPREEHRHGPQTDGRDGHGHPDDEGGDADQHYGPSRDQAQRRIATTAEAASENKLRLPSTTPVEPVSVDTSAGPSAP